MSLLQRYLASLDGAEADSGAAATYASLDLVGRASPAVAAGIVRELADQRRTLKLIASENYCSLATQLACGNWLTDKYAEGIPGHRFYAGCENVDAIEAEAAELARELFGAEHAYVQPHSGADANLVAYLAILSARVQAPLLEELGVKDVTKLDDAQWRDLRRRFGEQRLLGLDYYAGGHLTHGYRHNVSSRLFECHSYGVDPESGLIDLDALRRQIQELRPLVLLAGYSAYPRKLDFARMRELADEVGATFMVDMAHFAGLVAGRAFEGPYDPVPHAHIVTSTTHKTLRGPRGGIVLCKQELAEWVDKGCPAVLGGPLPHVIAAKAVAFREALQPSFRDYAARVVENARALAEALVATGAPVPTGGTDNHLVLVDVAKGYSLTGRQAESALRECGVTLNRNSLPRDPNGPWYTSGLRLGTAALTTTGMGPADMREVAAIVDRVLRATRPAEVKSGPEAGKPSKARYELDPAARDEAKERVARLLTGHAPYPELDLELLLSAPFAAEAAPARA